jgi:thiamine pyrophosphokinase
MAEDTVVVVSGAAPLTATGLAAVPPGAPVVAADAGVDHARAAGVAVSLAVGDFDSVRELGDVPAERHPAEKDATDLELALDAALALDPRRLLVLSGAGLRIDHLLVELGLVSGPRLGAVEVDAVFDRTTVHVVRAERRFGARVGDLVSLVAMHGPAVAVTTEGLVYPLRAETLEAGSSRGISNVVAEPEVRITLQSGVLLVLRPSG